MNINKGEMVQVRFNNGLFFDAIVEKWTDQKSILYLLDTKDKIVIQKTLQDVLFVKIIAQANKPENKLERKTNLQDEFDFLKTQPKTDNNLDDLSKLRDELNKIEREEILKQATSFRTSGRRETTYAFPRHIKIGSPPEHSSQETPTEDPGTDPEL